MVVESSFLVSVLCREAFSNPNIFSHSFCVTNFRTSFNDPLPSLYWWVVSVGEEEVYKYNLIVYDKG